jgi:hypothetical protein
MHGPDFRTNWLYGSREYGLKRCAGTLLSQQGTQRGDSPSYVGSSAGADAVVVDVIRGSK